MQTPTLKRASTTRYSPELHCRIVSGIGHFWVCERCGAHGKIMDYNGAQADKKLHACADLSPSGAAEAS
jgi:hypothetical protein